MGFGPSSRSSRTVSGARNPPQVMVGRSFQVGACIVFCLPNPFQPIISSAHAPWAIEKV